MKFNNVESKIKNKLEEKIHNQIINHKSKIMRAKIESSLKQPIRRHALDYDSDDVDNAFNSK